MSIDRRSQIEQDRSHVDARERWIVEAIAKGEAVEPLIAALKPSRTESVPSRPELDGLAHVGRIASLDAAKIKADLRERVADVRALLTENV